MEKNLEKLLKSYGRTTGLPLECREMEYIKKALETLIDEKIEHDEKVLVALAGIIGTLETKQFSANLMPFCISRSSDQEYISNMQKSEKYAITHSARWLIHSRKIKSPLSFFQRPSRMEIEETEKLLRNLFDKLYPNRLTLSPK